jgi:hypothetical protein
MSTRTVQQPSSSVPRLAKWATAAGAAALFLASGLLWWTQGAKVFLDTLAAGLAWCF